MKNQRKILSRKNPGENKSKTLARMRQEILSSLPFAFEHQIEEAMCEFAIIAEPAQLFTLAQKLSLTKKFENCAIHCIARSGTGNALAWLKARKNNATAQEAMEVWLLTPREN